MKNIIKTVFFILSFSIVSIHTNAQKLIIRGGLNFSNASLKLDGNSIDEEFKMRPGFNFSTLTEFTVTRLFSVETGLTLNTKGYQVMTEELFNEVMITGDSKINLLYLDIPLAGKVSIDVGNTRIYGNFGPYLGFGLAGETHSITKVGGEIFREFHEKIRWGSEAENFTVRRLDYGLNFGVGVEFKTIQIGVSYGLGLANILPEGDPDTDANVVLRNRVLSLSVGYIFGKK